MTAIEIPERLLIETGLSKEFVLKELRLNEALNELARLPFEYALYGGTAINKVYAGQKRFSEDLDLFVYGPTEREFAAGAKKIFPTLGAGRKILRESYRYDIGYEFPEHGVRDSIRLDVNFNFKRPPSRIVPKEPGTFLNRYGFFIRNRDVFTFEPAALAAGKLVALAFRTAGRDYFDLHHLLSVGFPTRAELLSELEWSARAFSGTARPKEDFLQQVADKIASADVTTLAATDQFILKPFRPDWRELVNTLAAQVSTLAYP